MKKILVFLVVALLALALVACAGDPPVTTKGEGNTTTDPATSTTLPGTSGGDNTPDTGDNTPDTGDNTPDTDEVGGGEEDRTYIDLINDLDYMALVAAWNGYDFYTFEDTHGSLDNHIALVLSFNDMGGVYTELFLNTTVEGETPVPNTEFSWVITVDGKSYDVTRFSLFNNGTSGWVRCDLGAEIKWSDFEWDENDQHGFMATLSIYDSAKELYYYADLNYLGEPTYFTKPEEMVIGVDADRPQALTQVGNTSYTAMSGPDAGNGEGYQMLFDGKVGTKICTNDNDDAGACIVKMNAPYTIAGISIVNANDNKTYTGRTLIAFDLYGSNDAESWTLVYTSVATDADGNAIDKAPFSTNYGENFYSFEVASDYEYYKLVPHNGEMWQASELLFWTED